jgi:hypothetical protein
VVWEVVFMLVILKIPVVYLCLVVWWAIRAEPKPLEGAALAVAPPEIPPGRGWRLTRGRPRRRGPHGGPARSYPRTARTALVRAASRR